MQQRDVQNRPRLHKGSVAMADTSELLLMCRIIEEEPRLFSMFQPLADYAKSRLQAEAQAPAPLFDNNAERAAANHHADKNEPCPNCGVTGWYRAVCAGCDWPMVPGTPAPAPVLTWQPIETAPRDESVKIELGILRKGKLDEVHIGGWRDGDPDHDELPVWWSDQADDEINPSVWRELILTGIDRLSPPSTQEGRVS